MEECLYASIAKPGSEFELVNDILKNMGMSHVTLLILLDVSAAFDTVDPSILFILRLQSMLGLSGSALQWLRSNLKDRSQ